MILDWCRQWYARVAVGIILSGVLACHDLSGISEALPAGIPNPNVYHTAAGALALYQNALAAFQYTNGTSTASIGGVTTNTSNGAFVDFMLQSGILTDELQSGDLGCISISATCGRTLDSLDARQIPDGVAFSPDLYRELQNVRNDATLGIGALLAYDSAASPALRGHLYALTGYAELMLADLFCSGVPLSTLNFNGSTTFTYASSSTTTGVYQAALANFDSAVALSSDSVRILNLAWVGKGRALLALDSFPQAAQAAAHVPNGFTYQFPVDWSGGSMTGGSLFQPGGYTVSDREGITGLPYRSSGDPRTATESAPDVNGQPQYVPLKYGGATPQILPITVADWIEARLIQAEAELQPASAPSGQWLTTLNLLRASAGLHDTTDPGTADGRINLLFRERAYWLFLTGHRQGDLRRLIRQYGRPSSQVYPTGQYPLALFGFYGNGVDVPIPVTDESPNPHFHGCLARGA